jgi:protein TonB
MSTRPANPNPAANWTRHRSPGETGIGVDFTLAIALHAAALAALIGASFLHPHGKTWGDQNPVAGSIQASMVSAIPLPPKQPVVEDKVLASDSPSPAPVVAHEATIPPPSPRDIPILAKPTPRPLKPIDRPPTPTPPKHAELKPPPPTKATTGETSGMRLPMSTAQLKNGTATMTVQDRNFGARFAYYVDQVNRRVSSEWLTQTADPRTSIGKRATILFDIDRDGVPSNIRVETRSGSPTLDISALRAVQRVDHFGPLPQGDHITVEFSFDYVQQ